MRPFCLYTVLFFLGACSSLDWALSDKNYDATRQNPQWIKHSAQSFNTAVAEIRQRQLHIYDKSVFKFNRINKLRKSEAPVLIKTPKTLPGSGLHLIINNQAASTVKQAIPKLSLSRIERMYHNSMGLSGGKGITQAGYQELKNSSSAKTAAVFPGYFLGPGDKLKVNITGSLNYGKTLTVDEKGFVFLPKGIGALRVFDKTVAELDDIFYDAIEREYKNFKVSVSLAEVRNIRILLSGKVVSPGLKQLPANASLLDALALAGGITKDGSLRQVSLHRKNGSVINLDLYQLFFKGDQNLDLLLRSGDHLIVPPIGPTICLSGDSNTGIYEVGKSQLQDLFNMHGKLNAFTSRQRIFFEKTVDGKRREIYSLPFDKLQKIQLQDGYVFEFQNVRNQLDNTVQLLGEVTRPGTYPWKSGMMLSGLLKRGEGFLLNASLHMALIKRRSQGEVLYKRQGSKGIIRVRDQLLWIPLDQVIAGKYDIALQRLDQLQIMSLDDWQDKAQIKVIGAVRKSGTFDLTQNMNLGDAIKLAGQT
ncbi:MAG: SLBB domain-containing protein, partial [Lentisphaeraceae bacterium]|nr:SLBB domain-containing protein [Lentisphaeraceae bacterium]